MDATDAVIWGCTWILIVYSELMVLN